MRSERSCLGRSWGWAMGVAGVCLLLAGCGAAGPSDSATAEPVGGDGTASLRWSAPQTRSDGSPLAPSEIGGYLVFVGRSSGVYDAVYDVGPTTEHTITGLSSGTYVFAVSAYDSTGLESGLSSEATKTVR